jgi:transcriptional regulator with XRE-family HTH domain
MSMTALDHERVNHVNTNVFAYSGVITHVLLPLLTLSERAKDARKELGLSQQQVAKKAGVTQGTIGNIESGERKVPRELLAIAKALEVRPQWLKDGTGSRKADLYVQPAHLAQESGVSAYPSWPFATITPHEWHELKPSIKSTAEDLILALIRGQSNRFPKTAVY